MQEKKNILTYEGLKRLEDELQDLKVVKRREIAQKIKDPVPEAEVAAAEPGWDLRRADLTHPGRRAEPSEGRVADQAPRLPWTAIALNRSAP